MRNARRLTASIIGAAIWFVAASTVAYAQIFPDPAGGGGVPTRTVVIEETSAWRTVLIVAIAALLTAAVVGLIASLRHSRSERPSSALHA